MSSLRKFLSVFQPSDYSISTWLLLGASIQCILVASLPRNISLLPPIAFLAYRICRGYLMATGNISNPYSKNVTHGRQTWMVPNADGTPATTPSSETIVVMVLGASWSHPNGLYSAGSSTMGAYFNKMWVEAENNREKYGFLGRTPGMSPEEYGDRKGTTGRTMISLSYWKSLDGLQKFASASAHQKGRVWWERGAKDEFPHIGMMHEVYEVPKGNWENSYHNFMPFGLSSTQYPVSSTDPKNIEEGKESVEWVNGLRSADVKEWRSMYGRMGRKAGAQAVQ